MKKAMLIVLLLIIAFVAVKPYADPISASTISAQQNVNYWLWFGAGCLFGILGLGAAYLMEPSAPATYLLGKDPTYIAMFTDNYKRVGKSIQTKAALWGCVASSMSGVLYYLFVYIIFAAAVTETYYY